jgi:hypothetical protein
MIGLCSVINIILKIIAVFGFLIDLETVFFISCNAANHPIVKP